MGTPADTASNDRHRPLSAVPPLALDLDADVDVDEEDRRAACVLLLLDGAPAAAVPDRGR